MRGSRYNKCFWPLYHFCIKCLALEKIQYGYHDEIRQKTFNFNSALTEVGWT